MPRSEKQKPSSGVQVSGVRWKEGSDEEERIQPIREGYYRQWPMRGEYSQASLTPGSRPASVDLATEAWRPRGRCAGTRRPGPHQTLPLAWDRLANGSPRPGLELLPPRRIHGEREENVVKFPARKISLSCSFIPELEQVSLLSFSS